MNEFKIGETVQHKVHGFKGEIVGFEDLGYQAVVKITEGIHPLTYGKPTYTAGLVSLTKVETNFEKMVSDILNELNEPEDEPVEEEIEVDINGSVTTTSNDGTEIHFEFYADFIDFMERTNTLQK